MTYFEIVAMTAGIAMLTAVVFFMFRRFEAESRARELDADLSNLRESHAALTANEMRYRTLVESTADLMWETDNSLTYTYCSPSVKSILGYSPTEMAGKKLPDLGVPEDASGVVEALNKTRETRTFGLFERSVVSKDGRRITLESSGLILFDSEDNIIGYRGLDRDITARKHLESEVRQGQKMEAVGQLVAGLADNFNDTLTEISACAALLKESDDFDTCRHAQAIETAVARSSSITRQLLAFSRKQIIRPVALDLSRTVSNLNPMLRRVIRENIEIMEDFESEPWMVKADAGQIEQIITNLVVNARDAMPEGGTIRLQTRNVTVEDAELTTGRYMIPCGNYVQLMVSDTGSGMDSATQARIFEPFFTTKSEDIGTGLGLASVYGIVKQSSGFINVWSEVGEGTTLEILFPRAEDSAQKVGIPAEVNQHACGTVLIVEDEEDVRLVTSEVLANQGYTVLTASGREEALDICRKDSESIDILLSDVVLPKASGPSIAAEIAATQPNIKVLFMSGYTGDTIGALGILDSAVNLIHKPFSAGALISALDAVSRGQAYSPRSLTT